MKAVFITIFSALVLYNLTCTPMPLENEKKFPIRLSLEKIGNKEAEFSGEPILTIIETNDSMMFSSLTWRTGNATYKTADSTLRKKSRKFTALLNWNIYPLGKDSIDKAYYDTIYLGTGGNLSISNIVRVKVSNLPVVIDSIRISMSTIKETETVWSYFVHDSITKLNVRLYARDLDGKNLELQISGNNYNIQRFTAIPLQFIYTIPSGIFRDTLTFVVYDKLRGQTIKDLYLYRVYPNTPPVIDSVQINYKIFKFVAGNTSAKYPVIDTLRFNAFYHDKYDIVKKTSWKSSRNIIKTDSLYPEIMTYICTTSAFKDTMNFETKVVDTIKLTVYDSQNDSAKSAIIILKGIVNRSPVIKQVYIDEKEKGDSLKITGAGLKKFQFRVTASDPDSNILKYKWKSVHGTLMSTTDSFTTYTTPATMITDTISVSVSDDEFTVVKKIVITVNDIDPKLDSLVINNVRYNASNSLFLYNAFIGEQLTITAWARDLDVKDTLKYFWEMTDSSKIVSSIKNRLVVKLPLVVYNDIITLRIEDGVFTKSIFIYINVSVMEPIIDSISVGAKVFKSKTDSISDSVTFPDTIKMKVYSHDDQLDTLKTSMTALIQKNLKAIDSISFNYTLKDSTCVDTLKVTVTDSKKNTSKKNIILFIKGKTK